ncbi:thymidylate synthase [Arenibaculum pallidiluteum]|uniref:thymidylate synthase n=1 Tax=Arenibaculum pallidiluteum TaxID=2812559 RepID=UPI001A96A8C6|nr:thymidylate synthase [Arenibaculum pallidiluteum]
MALPLRPPVTAVNHPEGQYLDLLRLILESGDDRQDRTGVGARSIFGAMMRFDLGRGFPLITTKRVFWKSCFREMLWFLTGGTNIRPLVAEGVHIWTDWPLKAYREATGEAIDRDAFERRIVEDEAFAARWGELGPVYGKQWRRWTGPDGREHDQIAGLIDGIRRNPASRRLLFHAWNVAEIDRMALPPCHMVYQFHVSRGRLSCLLYQRSADVLLGLPFNLAGASLLTHMLAQQCDLEPGELVWSGGDVHLYHNHLEQARLQLGREPRPFPRLNLLRRPDDIDGYRIEDLEVVGYDPHPHIKAEVAV